MAQITYADKTALNVNSSIADINKVNASDMNEIKSVVNTNDSNIGDLSSLATDTKTSIVSAINEIKNAEAYSTSEVKTNNVWIDNKPIYRKVIEKTVAASSSWTSELLSNYGITNFDYIYFANGSRRIQNNKYMKEINTQINMYIDVSNGRIYFAPDEYSNVYKVVLEYTKTS